MDGLRRTIARCLGLGGVLLATLIISAGMLAIFSAAGDHAVETVMKVVASVSLLALLVDGAVLLVAVAMTVSGSGDES